MIHVISIDPFSRGNISGGGEIIGVFSDLFPAVLIQNAGSGTVIFMFSPGDPACFLLALGLEKPPFPIESNKGVFGEFPVLLGIVGAAFVRKQFIFTHTACLVKGISLFLQRDQFVFDNLAFIVVIISNLILGHQLVFWRLASGVRGKTEDQQKYCPKNK